MDDLGHFFPLRTVPEEGDISAEGTAHQLGWGVVDRIRVSWEGQMTIHLKFLMLSMYVTFLYPQAQL